jgi:diguanylate cyclase (GGDEF)-like protein
MFLKKHLPRLAREEVAKYLIVGLLGAFGTYLANSIPKVKVFLAIPLTMPVGAILGIIVGTALITVIFVRLSYRARIATLELEASTDETTQVFNERALSSCFDETTRRSKKERAPFCVIVFDIDGFRDVNSRYGYQDANHILTSIVKQVRATIRSEDVLIRRHRSGDEFIIFAFNNFLTKGERTADRIREHIEKYPRFAGRANLVPAQITISAGVAECDVESESLDDVLRRADEALKIAKAKKNTVELSTEYESQTRPKKA